MLKEGLFLGWLVLVLAGCISSDPKAEAPLPVTLQPLSSMPGCYTSIPGDGDMMNAARQMQELNVSANIKGFVELTQAILADPLAESWTVTTVISDSIPPMTVEATLMDKTAGSAQLALAMTVSRNVNPDLLGEPIWEAHTSAGEMAAAYDLGEARFPGSVTRWTDDAVELRWFEKRPVYDAGGGSTVVEGVHVMTRGCDPASQISFGSFEPGLLCWTSTGAFVTCEGVNLWP